MPRSERTQSPGTQAKPGASGTSPLAKMGRKGKEGGMDLQFVDIPRFIQMLDTLTTSGALVSLSRTTDGGAICLYVRDGTDAVKRYVAHPVEFDEVVNSLLEAYSG